VANALGCILVAIPYLASLHGPLDAGGQVITGDFLNFYNGARMVVDGQGHSLYDVNAQHQALLEITGPDYPNHHWYNYPPTWAILLAPIGALPYVQAFYVYDALMAAAMVGTLLLLRPVLPGLVGRVIDPTTRRLRRVDDPTYGLPGLRRAWLVTVLAVVFFHPIIRNIIGGQNTVLTMFLLAGWYAGLRTNRPIRAGVFLGLLLYKPQFAVPLGLIVALRGQWRTLAAAGCVGLAHYALGAAFCGFDWPMRMLAFLGSFQAMEARLNAATHVSLLSSCRFALPAGWAEAVAIMAMLAVVAVLLRLARLRGDGDEAAYWALAITAMLLLSPHTQYYDAGILVLPVLIGLDRVLQATAEALPEPVGAARACFTGPGHPSSSAPARPPSTALRICLLVGYFAYPVYGLSQLVGFQPLLLWPVLTFVWLARLMVRTGTSPEAAPSLA